MTAVEDQKLFINSATPEEIKFWGLTQPVVKHITDLRQNQQEVTKGMVDTNLLKVPGNIKHLIDYSVPPALTPMFSRTALLENELRDAEARGRREQEREDHRDRDMDRDRRDQRQRDRPQVLSVPRTLQYDGSSNFDTWKYKFTNFLAMNRIESEDQKIFYVSLSLEGTASTFFEKNHARQPYLCVANALKALQQRFGKAELREAAILKLHHARQLEGENVVTFKERVWDLADLVYDEHTSRQMERHVMVAFAAGLRDKECASYLATLRLNNIEQTMDALELFNYSRELKYTHDDQQKKVRMVRSESPDQSARQSILKPFIRPQQDTSSYEWERRRPNTENGTLDRLENSLNTLCSEFKEMRAEISTVKTELSTVKREMNPRQQYEGRYDRSRSPGQRACHGCGSWNHFLRDCPDARRDRERGRSPRGGYHTREPQQGNPRSQSPHPRSQSPHPRSQSPYPRNQSPHAGGQSPRGRSQSPYSGSRSNPTCNNCGSKTHFWRECPQNNGNAPNASGSASTVQSRPL